MLTAAFIVLAEFRRRHLKALGDLFVQVLKLCREAGLVKLGNAVLDGTKMKANASKHKAMSYGRMRAAEARLQAEVTAWFARAAAADAAEDGAHGPARGDELPDWVANKQQRLERLRRAKATLEAEAKAPPADDDGPGPSTGMVITASRGALRTAARPSGRSATSPTPTAASSRPGTA